MMVLGKYIKVFAITVCTVLALTVGSVQTANDEQESSVDMVACTTPKTTKQITTTACSATKEVTTCAVAEIAPETTQEVTEQEYIDYFTDSDVADMAKVLYRECGGVPSKTEQACVAWCVLNRVDKNGSSIYKELRAPNQFAFYESTEVRDDMFSLAKDVLTRWNDEKNGKDNVGRVLPVEYTYFHGDGGHNYFRNAFDGNYDTWDYSLESPYENQK